MDIVDWEFLTALVGLAGLFGAWAVDAHRHPGRWTR